MATLRVTGTVYNAYGNPFTGKIKFIPDRRLQLAYGVTMHSKAVEVEVTDGELDVQLEPGRYFVVFGDGATKPTAIFLPNDAVEPVDFNTIVTGTSVTITGIIFHDDLLRRDDADQHPISAITGLQSALDSKADQTGLDAHVSDTNNPHQVTYSQVGADPAGTAEAKVTEHEAKADPHPQYATDSDLAAHTSRTDNPHNVTYDQVGADPAGAAAAVQSDLDTHKSNYNNPHQVTAEQVGADPVGTAEAKVAEHEAKTDPHPQYATDNDVAAVQEDLDAHKSNYSNPHQVTAEQVGADPAGTAQSFIQTHENSNNVHAITAVTGLQAELLARGKYWGELTVAELPTEEDGVKPGDSAWVTDALNLDGEGGLYVYDKNNGWVDIHFRIPATTSLLDVYRAALDAPYGRYKRHVIVPGWGNLYASSGYVTDRMPLYDGSSIGKETVYAVQLYGDPEPYGAQESKAMALVVPAPNYRGEIRYSIARRYRGMYVNYSFDNITSPEISIYSLFLCGIKSSGSLKLGGVIHTIEYDEDSNWYHRTYIGILDYDLMQIDGTMIEEEIVDPADIPIYYIEADFFLCPYTDATYSNHVRIEYNGETYYIDYSNISASLSNRTPVCVGYIKNTGDSANQMYWNEVISTIVMAKY